MIMPKVIISPKTKVGELLDAYPELEEVLMEMSPAFHKLKNPILRKTVAKVATLQQISVVGGLPVESIINRLRSETGQDQTTETFNDGEQISDYPQWVDESQVVSVYNAIPVINAGESPMTEILKRANELKQGEILEVQTPFIPAPIIDMLKSKKFLAASVRKGEFFCTYIRHL